MQKCEIFIKFREFYFRIDPFEFILIECADIFKCTRNFHFRGNRYPRAHARPVENDRAMHL